MKLILALLFSTVLQNAYAFKETSKYTIFEKDDNEAHEFINFLRQSYPSLGFTPLQRSNLTEQMYTKVDRINEKIHQTYLDYFSTSEEEFPLPYVVLDRANVSANFGKHDGSKVKTTNFISISFGHVKDEAALWSVLAHEIAHYYHDHMSSNNFIRASYTDHRQLNEENAFGENIEHDPELARRLEAISMAAQRFVGGRMNVDSLTSLVIGPSDPIMRLLPNIFHKLTTFSETDTNDDLSCYGLQNIIRKLRTNKQLDLNVIQEIDQKAKICPATKDVSYYEFLYHIVKPTNLALQIIQTPRMYTRHPESSIRSIAEGIDQGDHPLAMAFKMIYNYRIELKELVETIRWDKLQYFTKENQADITSFKILNELGLAHYQTTFLDLIYKKNNCINSINEDEIEVEYYSHSELDTHNSMCWRLYRTNQMLNSIKKIDTGIY